MSLVVLALVAAAIYIWAKNKEFNDLKADYDQATFAAWRLLMLADNGEELHDQMKQWTLTGGVMIAIGEEIQTGNRRVMRVNTAILDHSKGQPWSEVSEKFRSALKGMGL